MSIRIITDSAADLDKRYIEEHNIIVLPFKIVFGDDEYSEGIDITSTEFYEKLIEYDNIPSTSQLNPYEFEKVYENIKNDGDQAIVISLSSKLSGTAQNAKLASMDYEDIIYTVDSENATVGEQILVRRAVELIDLGKSINDIVDILEKEKKDICLVALLDTLEYLKKGGRLSSTAAVIGGMLNIKPVVGVEDGQVVVLGKARGSKKGNNMLVEQITKNGGIDFSRPLMLGYTGLNDMLLTKYIEDSGALWKDLVDSLEQCVVGSTIGTHVGPGAIAIGFFSKK